MQMHESVEPLVSVVIPCYNAENFVEAAVRSVMEQSYSNLEIIVVNDCSADKSRTILEKLQKEDERIIILDNDRNSGISTTLNKGLENSKGQYIARMDADDICFKNRIEKQVSFFNKNETIALCSGNFLKINEHDKVVGKVNFPPNNNALKAELLFYCPFAHPAVMMRKSALNKTGLYYDYAPAEDYELWLRIAEKFQVANIPENLIYYRTHARNTTIIQKNKLFSALSCVVQKHIKTFGFAKNYVQYHLKFLEGTWYRKTSVEEIRNIKNWKKELFALHKNNDQLHQVFNKYISLAMLSILKSNQNLLRVKFAAAAKLLTINPFITIKHFFR